MKVSMNVSMYVCMYVVCTKNHDFCMHYYVSVIKCEIKKSDMMYVCMYCSMYDFCMHYYVSVIKCEIKKKVI